MSRLPCALLALPVLSMSAAASDRFSYRLDAWFKGWDLYPNGVSHREEQMRKTPGYTEEMMQKNLRAYALERERVLRDRKEEADIITDTDGEVFRCKRRYVSITFLPNDRIEKNSVTVDYGSIDTIAEFSDTAPDGGAVGWMSQKLPPYSLTIGTWLAPWIFGAFPIDQLPATVTENTADHRTYLLGPKDKPTGELKIWFEKSRVRRIERRAVDKTLAFTAEIVTRDGNPAEITLQNYNSQEDVVSRRHLTLASAQMSPPDINLAGMGVSGTVIHDSRAGKPIPREVGIEVPNISELKKLAGQNPHQLGRSPLTKKNSTPDLRLALAADAILSTGALLFGVRLLMRASRIQESKPNA